jgi:predicted ferric reductase
MKEHGDRSVQYQGHMVTKLGADGLTPVNYHHLQQQEIGLSGKTKRYPAVNAFAGMMNRRVLWLNTPVYAALFAISYFLLNVGCFFLQQVFVGAPNWRVSPHLAVASLIKVNILFLPILATRNSVLTLFVGTPFEKAITFHRWQGYFSILLVSLHVALGLWSFQLSGGILSQLRETRYIFGLTAFSALIIMLITSLEVIRRKFFEVFYFLHYLFLVFYVLSVLHAPTQLLPWVLASAVLYFIDKLMRFVWGLPQKTISVLVKGEKDPVISIRLHKRWEWIKSYKVGQYVFLNFPSVSLIQWHPFSISCGPNETSLEVTIKPLGGFTRDLLQKVKSNSELTVRVDGPYGNPQINYKRFPVLTLIAGGIGVTPCIGILRDLYATGERKAKKTPDLHSVNQVYFIWVVQTVEQYHWFANELHACFQATENNTTLPPLDIRIYVTRESNAGEIFLTGRPNFDALFTELSNKNSSQPMMVFACGPQSLIQSCWYSSTQHSLIGKPIHFHHETFEL